MKTNDTPYTKLVYMTGMIQGKLYKHEPADPQQNACEAKVIRESNQYVARLEAIIRSVRRNLNQSCVHESDIEFMRDSINKMFEEGKCAE